MLIGRKGVETLIAWVLLIGLSISLAALVTNWAINNVNKFRPEDQANQDLYCGDVSISINSGCEVKNTGVFGIDKIILQPGGKIPLSPRLLPGESRRLDTDYGINMGCAPGTSCDAGDCISSIAFIPVTINEDGGDVVCSVKKEII